MYRKIMVFNLFIAVLFAQIFTDINSNNSRKKEKYIVGKNIPYSQEPVEDFVKRYRFELNTDMFYKYYREIFKQIKNRKKILMRTYDISILMKPSKRLIKPVDLIYLSTGYITQILFPENMKVTNAIASVPTTVFDYAENEIRIRPTKDFATGNIIVHLTNGTKNYTMNILIEDYLQKRCIKKAGKYYCKNDNKSGLYKYAYENLSLIYKYTFQKPLDDLQIINIYEKLYNKKLNIRKDGDFVAFVYKDITYYIYRNDKFGNIFYRGKKYLIRK